MRRVQSTNLYSYDGRGNKAAILCCCYDTKVVVKVFVSRRQEDWHSFLVVATLRIISWNKKDILCGIVTESSKSDGPVLLPQILQDCETYLEES